MRDFGIAALEELLPALSSGEALATLNPARLLVGQLTPVLLQGHLSNWQDQAGDAAVTRN